MEKKKFQSSLTPPRSGQHSRTCGRQNFIYHSFKIKWFTAVIPPSSEHAGLFLREDTQFSPSHLPSSPSLPVHPFMLAFSPRPHLAVLTGFFPIAAFSPPVNYVFGGRELLCCLLSISVCTDDFTGQTGGTSQTYVD